jgi:hypothetical protein
MYFISSKTEELSAATDSTSTFDTKSSVESTGDLTGCSLSSLVPPPVPTEMPISILASSKDSRQMKKRVRFPDETSGDDNFSEYTSNELYTDFESQPDGDPVSETEVVEGHQSSDIDSTSDETKEEREQPVRSPVDSTEDLVSNVEVESVAADSSSVLEEIKYIEPRPDPMDEVAVLADELLINWSDLKVFIFIVFFYIKVVTPPLPLYQPIAGRGIKFYCLLACSL